MMTLQQYKDALHTHDWHFEHSDDQAVWRKGVQERGALLQAQRVLDTDWAVWNAIAPFEHRRSL